MKSILIFLLLVSCGTVSTSSNLKTYYNYGNEKIEERELKIDEKSYKLEEKLELGIRCVYKICNKTK